MVLCGVLGFNSTNDPGLYRFPISSYRWARSDITDRISVLLSHQEQGLNVHSRIVSDISPSTEAPSVKLLLHHDKRGTPMYTDSPINSSFDDKVSGEYNSPSWTMNHFTFGGRKTLTASSSHTPKATSAHKAFSQSPSQ
ncbi:hypothetical protein CDV31_013627 [Fusarium ambrosium]|uniref:Uncharacterized protein n=1 Tax=Fusarium ambrosium TaxID=131363 RepID=A0A428T225_9HYPO|nr:hypothetical protein CDV31_013627 [Fusarium ambrosium]